MGDSRERGEKALIMRANQLRRTLAWLGKKNQLHGNGGSASVSCKEKGRKVQAVWKPKIGRSH